MESAQFPSSSQGPKFVLSAVKGQPSDALSVSGVITNVGQLTAARRLANITGSACLSASRSTWGGWRRWRLSSLGPLPPYMTCTRKEKIFIRYREMPLIREGLKQKGKPLF